MSSLVNQEVHVDKNVKPRRTIHLLHSENKDSNSHYCCIKNSSRFACHEHGNHGERTYTNEVMSAAFSPDGLKIVSASWDKRREGIGIIIIPEVPGSINRYQDPRTT
jgi:hypothetical protein